MRKWGNQGRAFTRRLESEALTIKDLLIKQSDSPSTNDLKEARAFLLDVELWKADCLEEKTGLAAMNGNHEIWHALLGVINAVDDLRALRSVMTLVGFGSAKDEITGQRRAKRATAVMRFLEPDNWGVVDWRTAAFLCLYDHYKGDCEQVLKHGSNLLSAKEARDTWDVINEQLALQYVQRYRTMRDAAFTRAVDVELALYGASFLVWPPHKQRNQFIPTQ